MHMSPDMAKLSVVRNTKLGDNAFPSKLCPEGIRSGNCDAALSSERAL